MALHKDDPAFDPLTKRERELVGLKPPARPQFDEKAQLDRLVKQMAKGKRGRKERAEWE